MLKPSFAITTSALILTAAGVAGSAVLQTVHGPVLIGELTAIFGILILAGLAMHLLTRAHVGMAAAIQDFTRDATALAPRPTEAQFEERVDPERMLVSAVETASDPIITSLPDGTITAWNSAAERLYQNTAAEAIGSKIEVTIPPDRIEEHRDIFGKALNGEAIKNVETVRLAKDGRRIEVSLGLSPVKSRTGKIIGTALITRDITERKRIERLQDEYVSTVSHELRTPLTSISTSLALLTGGAPVEPDTAKRLIAIAYSNTQRLVRLVNEILDVEKIHSGKDTFNLQGVEVGSLIGHAIEATRALADSHSVRLRLRESSAPEVRADPDRLMQVVINLLSNAIKFSPAEAEVIVAIENYNDNVRITVRDHGPGIPQDFRSRIFEKFAQADGLNARQRGGTGLGLSIVKQIVVQLGGEVGFSDAPGGGTIFYVDLLRWQYGVDAGLKGNEELNRVRILLCESDTDVAIAMSKRLCQEGFEIDLSRTAAGAIAKAMTTFYSAILVDLQLRDCDGIALLQQLRAQPKCCDTPIFVVSAVPGRGPDDLRSSSLNVLDWFNKPLDIPRLLGRLRATIARGGSTWLRVIHLDHDSEVRGIVAQALEGHADVVSVATNESARHALVGSGFDLAVIELAMGMGSSCRLLPELIDGVYGAIPVIVYSTPLANSVCVAEVRTALVKTQASMDRLVASLRKSVVPTFQTAEKRGR